MKDTSSKLLYLLMAVLIVVAVVQSYVIYDMKHVLESKHTTVAPPHIQPMTTSPFQGSGASPMSGVDPFAQMKKMQEEMQKHFGTFNSMFSNDPFFQEVFDKMSVSPLADFKEDRSSYVIELDIPGAKEQNIEIKSENNVVKVYANSNRSQDVNGTNYIHKERYIQQFERSFVLPNDADTAKMHNRYENGILTITIPKKGS